MLLFPNSSANALESIFRSSYPITKRHGESRIIGTHPLHLFRIIQDVDQYQDFLPLCQLSQVDQNSIRANGRYFQAKLKVGRSPLFSEEYISQVTVHPKTLRVETESICIKSFKFDLLRSSWKLKQVGSTSDHDGKSVSRPKNNKDEEQLRILRMENRDTPSFSKDSPSLPEASHGNVACHVDFEVEMTVSNPAIVAVLDQILMQVAGRQVEAFDKRCKEIPWPLHLIQQIEGNSRM